MGLGHSGPGIERRIGALGRRAGNCWSARLKNFPRLNPRLKREFSAGLIGAGLKSFDFFEVSWRAIQNKSANSYIIEISMEFRRP